MQFLSNVSAKSLLPTDKRVIQTNNYDVDLLWNTSLIYLRVAILVCFKYFMLKINEHMYEKSCREWQGGM